MAEADELFDDGAPDCDHWDGCEIDLLTGRKTCDRCGEFVGYATDADFEAMFRWEQEFYDAMDREARRENRWWRRLWRWLTAPTQRMEVDDEIPL